MKSYIKDYPRPQFVREEWQNLNGDWNFTFDDGNIGEKEKWFEKDLPNSQRINVPFTYETPLSGIADEAHHNYVWYQRDIELDSEAVEKGRTLLHFEGSDFITKVWVNGVFIGQHTGGYSRFSFDIAPNVVEGRNVITVRCEDHSIEDQPRGKQRWIDENFGCWYVQTTGIWKTVWLEHTAAEALDTVKMTPHLTEGKLSVTAEIQSPHYEPGLKLAVDVSFKGINVTTVLIPVKEYLVSTDIDIHTTKVSEWGIKTWSPEDPNLYDISFTLLRDGEATDIVLSYFGMRDVRIDGSTVLLNGQPLYQRMILDQGYWEDGHLTPPNEEALIEDIDKIMELGYNGIRKHQKIEDQRFLYWCDVKGVVVWSEYPATYRFTDRAMTYLTKEWMEVVAQHYNHPSIITWVPFNESWGVKAIKHKYDEQVFTEAIYYLTKAFDPMRPVVVNDGWEHTISDIITLHDYEEDAERFLNRYLDNKDAILSNEIYHSNFKCAMADGYQYIGQPVILSEFGGIAFDGKGEGWGYGNKVNDEEAFIERFDKITTAIKNVPWISGYCYTQVTDVQQEVNGLMDMKRNFKIDPSVIREVNERIVSPADGRRT